MHDLHKQTKANLKAQYEFSANRKIEAFGLEPILDLEFESGDHDKTISIRDYLKELLLELWKKEESFSGKRPFGNSCWTYEIYTCLVKNNYCWGLLDEYGNLEDFNCEFADQIVFDLIEHIFTKR